MAEKTDMDSVNFRLHNLKDKRMIRVLNAAADKFSLKSQKKLLEEVWGLLVAPMPALMLRK